MEEEETAWLRKLQSEESREGRKGKDDLTPRQRKAVKHFQEHGGHAGRYTNQFLEYICNNGAIILLELEVRDNVWVTIGSISALREAPVTRGGSLHKATPNFDLRDVKIHGPAQEQAFATAKDRIVICRTTIREVLSSKRTGVKLPEELEKKNMRRLGSGFRVKRSLLGAAIRKGKKRLTFNIGSIFNTVDPNASEALVLANNKPSKAHNSWMKIWAARHKYHNELLDHILMLWTAYDGSIDEGMEAFEGDEGGLRGKGILDIDTVDLEADSERIFEQICWEEDHLPGRRGRRWDD
jgi:hypothetical protein